MIVNRRTVLQTLGLAAAATLPSMAVYAAPPARLDVKDPAALALGYVENATQVDVKKYPTYSAGSLCENCLQLQGSAGDHYRACGLFPGKLVSVSGWCTGWTPEI